MVYSIPKIIHYCWFGRNPLPPLARKCIASWRKYLPDYEIKEWNEDNFDVNAIPYTREAYAAKKYAFVSDYARFKILYEEGGLYFDTDVEVIRPLDDIIARGPFMGCEGDATNSATAPAVAPGLGLGVNPGQGLYKEILKFYRSISFNEDNKEKYVTVVEYVTKLLCKRGLQNIKGIQCIDGIYIYPKEYFCPLSPVESKNEIHITRNTRTIHHYAGSWLPYRKKIKQNIVRRLGTKKTSILIKIKNALFRHKR